VIRFRPRRDRVNPRYLTYLLRSPYYREVIIGVSGGAAITNISQATLGTLVITLPPLPVQRKIASILTTYDDLIENNTQRIKILEEIAQSIYREWFVNFIFPGHENVSLVDTGTELGAIPMEWKVVELGNICNIVMGQSPESKYYNEDGIGLPFHQGVTNFSDRFPIDKVYCLVENRIAEKGDILMSVRAPVGRLNIANKRIVIGRGLCAIRSKHDNQAYIFQQLKVLFREEDTMGGGTIFKAVTKADVHGIKVLLPPENLIDRYEQTVNPIFALVENLTIKNTNLQQSRNLLLPKLVSGELDVSELEIIGNKHLYI
jgi:type I restriction enzyme S subunit